MLCLQCTRAMASDPHAFRSKHENIKVVKPRNMGRNMLSRLLELEICVQINRPMEHHQHQHHQARMKEKKASILGPFLKQI
ncbi:hypothetical protein MKW98_009382 [Papaver atlanticum]|uniref:Uncharacterized protein n=1 Tax=Papaver atlanticum TaxID=357466 RepID=A0AAD4RYP9_9MAGN|nr:hypothetical protein MKW98_009382 [Papaver atlanticum]